MDSIKMSIEKCKKNQPKKKVTLITIRRTEDVSKWLKDNEYSATAIFYEAIKTLGYKKDN